MRSPGHSEGLELSQALGQPPAPAAPVCPHLPGWPGPGGGVRLPGRGCGLRTPVASKPLMSRGRACGWGGRRGLGSRPAGHEHSPLDSGSPDP